MSLFHQRLPSELYLTGTMDAMLTFKGDVWVCRRFFLWFNAVNPQLH